MARSANGNYTASGTAFEVATADTDAFDAGDLQLLAAAVRDHDHSATKGLGVARLAAACAAAGSIIPAAVVGTPAQHGLYRDNILKGWVFADTAGGIVASYNVSSLTDNGTGDLTVTWDRDFATTSYGVFGGAQSDAARWLSFDNTAKAVGSQVVKIRDQTGALADPNNCFIAAVGGQ